jgi:hypothetical protein
MHNNLSRIGSNIEQIPHHELLIVTHGLAIEFMMSCALPPEVTESWQPFLVKQEEDGKEFKIFKGLLNIYILKAPLQMPLSDNMLIALETSSEIAQALKFSNLTHAIRGFAVIEELESKTRIVAQSTMGLIKLQSAMGIFFTENFPNFQLPIGLDTEIYVQPLKRKYTRLGFREVAATA